jgi:hypothetical protein
LEGKRDLIVFLKCSNKILIFAFLGGLGALGG